MRKVKTTKKSSKKVVKKVVRSKKKTINQLVYQDMKELSKHCTSKYFNNLESAEKALTDLFSAEKVQEGMKDKCLDIVKSGLTATGAMKIELVFNNDKTLSSQFNEMNKKVVDFLDELITKMKK